MTTVKFSLDEDGGIKRFSVLGHSGYAEEGSDIVCAAVSATVQMLEMCIAETIGENLASFTVNGEAEISYNVPENLTEQQAFAVGRMLDGFKRFMHELSEQYKPYLTFETEVKKC